MPDFVVDLAVTYEIRVRVSNVDDEEAAAEHAKEVYDMYLPKYPQVTVDNVVEEHN